MAANRLLLRSQDTQTTGICVPGVSPTSPTPYGLPERPEAIVVFGERMFVAPEATDTAAWLEELNREQRAAALQS